MTQEDLKTIRERATNPLVVSLVDEIFALQRRLADAEKWRDEYREKALAGQDAINALVRAEAL